MVQYLEENDLFNSSQHGFRRKRSCLNKFLSHFENIIGRLEADNNVDIIYLDFSKAFEKVDHLIY